MMTSVKSLRELAEQLFPGEVHLVSELVPVKLFSPDYHDNLFFVERSGDSTIMLLSGVHHDELEAPQLTLKYLSDCETSRGFIVYPILNHGFAVDCPFISSKLERNFFDDSPATSLDSRLFMDFLRVKNDFDLFIDVHEHELEQGLVYASKRLKLPGVNVSIKPLINDSVDYVSRVYGKPSYTVELPLTGKTAFLKRVLDYFF